MTSIEIVSAGAAVIVGAGAYLKWATVPVIVAYRVGRRMGRRMAR